MKNKLKENLWMVVVMLAAFAVSVLSNRVTDTGPTYQEQVFTSDDSGEDDERNPDLYGTGPGTTDPLP